MRDVLPATLVTLGALISASADAMDLSVPEVLSGAPSTVTVTGASPGATVFLAGSTRQGAGPCPPPLGGLCLDLVNPVQAGRAVADASGVAQITFTYPANYPLVDIYLQGVQAGPTPAETAVIVAPVLLQIDLGWYEINDAASLETARRIVRTTANNHFIIAPGAPYAGQLDLPYLQSVSGQFRVNPGTDLVVNAPALTSAQEVRIRNFAAPNGTVEVNLPALVSARVVEVDAQSTCSARLPALGSVEEVIVTDSDDTTLDLSGLVSAHEVVAYYNTGQVQLGLGSLVHITHYVELYGNPGVTSIDGWFPALTAAGAVSIGSNDNLGEILQFGAAAGVTAGRILTFYNAALRDVTGLHGVRSGDVTFQGNPLLPACDATTAALTIGDPTPVCYGNFVDACTGNGVCW